MVIPIDIMSKPIHIPRLDQTILDWSARKSWYFCIGLLIVHLGLSLTYGYYLPWGGDEWYTYRDQVFIGTPNNWLVLVLKKILGPVTVDNYFWYRQVGLFWTVWIYPAVALILHRTAGSENRATLLLFLLIFTFSPFVWFQEQMFRYYGLYLLYSFLVNMAIYFRNISYTHWRWLFYLLFLLSFPIHYLITWQLAFYISWKEFSLLPRRYQILTLFVGILIGSAVFLNLDKIWKLIFIYGTVAGDIRGWGMQSLLKPPLSIFQYLAGYELLPTERMWVLVLFILTGLLLIGGLLISLTKPTQQSDYLFAGIIPFLATFLLLEPITMPGATNLESKHAMFFMFWMTYYLVVAINFARSIGWRLMYSIPAVMIVVVGMYYSFTTTKPDWRRIGQLLEGCDMVFTDGPTRQTLNFYTTSLDPKPLIETIWDTIQVRLLLNKSNSVAFVLSDYKQYQLLTKEQMWNTGTSSLERFSHINTFFSTLEKANYRAMDTYTHYPLLAYQLSKQKKRSLLPWFYGYPYADLHFPLSIGQDTLLGMHVYQQGDTLLLDQSFYYLIEAQPGLGDTSLTILRSSRDSLHTDFNPLIPEENTFRSVCCRALQDYEKPVYEWYKRPLLSSSLAYPGSMLPGRGKIFRFQPRPDDRALLINIPGIRLYRFISNH